MKKILEILKSKWAEYLIEILVIIIGVLGAFLLSSWNEERKLENIKITTLSALISEFEANSASLQECLERIRLDRLYADSLRMQIGPGEPTLTINQMYSWFGQFGTTERCKVATDILEDVRSSGDLRNIVRVEIRRNIGKWSSALGELKQPEDEWAREFSSQFMPYTSKWMSWDSVDKSILRNIEDSRYYNSKFEVDPRIMLQQFEFENVMNLHYYRIYRAEDRVDILLKQTDQVLGLMQKELNGNNK